MKKLIFLLGLFTSLYPTIIFAQKEFYNLDFEKSDSVGKNIFQWKYENDLAKFSIDSSNSATGKNCLYVKIFHSEERASYYMVLPKSYYKGMRSLQVSLQTKMPCDSPNTVFWFYAIKDKERLGGASSSRVGHITYHTITPFSWTPNSFKIDIEKDPTEVRIGMDVVKDRAWFDDLKIEINGKPVNDLIFEISPNK